MDERARLLAVIRHLSAARSACAERDWMEAQRTSRLALDIDPQNVEALALLGRAYREVGDLDGARSALMTAIHQVGFLPALHADLGLIELARGDFAAAAASFGRASAAESRSPSHRHNLARALAAADQPQAAAQALAGALVLDPDLPDALGDLAGMLRDSGNARAAVAAAERALSQCPDDAGARWNRALALLQTGDFARGFIEYEARWRHGPFAAARRHGALAQPSDLALAGRRLLVWCEQGLGDAIQFVRYVPLLIGLGAEIWLEAPARLHRLLASLRPAPHLITPDEATPKVDGAIAVGSLPALFGGRIPAETPYLSAPEDAAAKWRLWASQFPGRKIGIAWQGNPKGSIDRGRSIPLAAFAPLAALTECTLIVLQKQHGMEQIESVDFSNRLHLPPDLDSGGEAFIDTAALIGSLDLVVTSDTSIAHLAGALGARIHLALKQVPDWRWLMAGTGSPWYPTMTVFRQSRRGDWDELFARMAYAISRNET